MFENGWDFDDPATPNTAWPLGCNWGFPFGHDQVVGCRVEDRIFAGNQ